MEGVGWLEPKKASNLLKYCPHLFTNTRKGETQKEKKREIERALT